MSLLGQGSDPMSQVWDTGSDLCPIHKAVTDKDNEAIVVWLKYLCDYEKTV